MSLISLKNVSKFYYSKGVIASGFTKVNVDFNDGEFVAITGESGSGKSTLLNVISGLDSYEEGEMYINGEETSHYTERDFEDYRRKYIGNIFQSFNLVNSYTVYQNIELVLLLNGNKKKDIKQNVLDLIKKVGLNKFKNTKVSKLSGGQKQRVAIARALAKETPIIIADEPTGNLDSRSATEVLKLLSEIAQDKLVIIVTHNYDQIEKYVTRKITMHDGRITEDKIVKENNNKFEIKTTNYKKITLFNKIRLGIRNAFNIKVKFLLLLFMFLFIICAITVNYSSNKEDEVILQRNGVNNYLMDTNDKKIIIKKKDKTAFNDEDYKNISKLKNISVINKDDIVLDSMIDLTDAKSNIFITGFVKDLSLFNGELTYGRMPENDNEMIAVSPAYDYYLAEKHDEVLDSYFYLYDGYGPDTFKKFKIVGIKLEDINDVTFYAGETVRKSFVETTVAKSTTTKIKFNDTFIKTDFYDLNNKIIASDKVKDGTIVLSSNHNEYCKNYNCKNKTISINVKNVFYEDTVDFKAVNIYNKYNFNRLTGMNSYKTYGNSIYISRNDYAKLYNRGTFQSSVEVKNLEKIYKTNNDLNNIGFNTFVIKDHLVVFEPFQYLQIFMTILTIILVAILFIITYFVTKVILKSRRVYFSTIRMLGSTKKDCKNLLTIELLTITNLASGIFAILLVLQKLDYINVSMLNKILTYCKLPEYIFVYVLVNIMSYIISLKYSKKIFTNSAASTLREDD